MRLISMRSALPPMLQGSCSIITRKGAVIFPGRATRRNGRPQRFDLIPGLGCDLAAQCVMLEFDKNGRPAGGTVTASVRNAPS